MYPDQNQPGGVVPGPSNDYDFIVNPGSPQPPKKGLLPSFGGGGLAAKLIPIIGIGIGLIILMWVVALIFGGGGANIQNAVGLTQTQQEIIRVTTLGEEDAFNQKVRDVSANTKLTVSTQQQQWIVFLANEGRTVEKKELALKMNSDIDTELETAKTNGTFDEVYLELFSTMLQAYAGELERSFNATEDADEQALLAQHFQQVELLIEQLPDQPES